MNQPEVEISPLAAAISSGLAVASLTAFVLWIRRWITQGYVLPYQPRKRLPWGPAAGGLAALMTLMGVANAISMRLGTAADAEFDPHTFVQSQFWYSLIQIAFAACLTGMLVFATRASLQDLGLPNSTEQLLGDLKLGLWVALASMVPLYAIQLAAVLLLGIPAEHPLLTQMASTPNAWVFVAVMFAAAVVAPVFEELVYRLLLQGGLERWEDEQIAWPLSYERDQPRLELAVPDPGEEPTELGHRIAPGSELLDDSPKVEDFAPVEPGGIGPIRGLAHGWAPILASSFLFALAHLGAGPSPIALFVFAMFLGYTYQRTHRMVPCITAHAILNFISVAIMFLSTSGVS